MANWSNEDDGKIRKELKRLSNDLDRMRRLKVRGLAGLPEELKNQVARLLESFRNIGLFLVPVGELEGWLASEYISESKENKAAWSNAAAMVVQSIGRADGDVWAFMRDIAKYLQKNDGVE